MRRLLAVPLIATTVLVATADAADAARRQGLVPFKTCGALVDEARDEAQDAPVPFRGPMMGAGSSVLSPRAEYAKPDESKLAFPEAATAVSGSVSDSATGSSDVESSTTNVQEAGIDEPDLVKAVGGKLFVIAGKELWALDATGPTTRVLGKLDLGATGGTLLIEGNRALVMFPRQYAAPSVRPDVGSGPRADVAIMVAPSGPSRLTEVDLTDPAAMKLLRTMEVPGDLVTARLTDGTARIVFNSAAGLEGSAAGTAAVATPVDGISAKAARKLRTSSFVPRTKLTSNVTGRTFRRSLVRCPEVRHPVVPAGTDLLTVLSVDLRKGLFNIDRDAILGSAQVVYASAGALYVASSADADVQTPADVPARPRTQIHRFDTSVRDQTTYAESGSVPGYVLGQYSLGEHKGALRVASTEEPSWVRTAANAEANESQSSVTVLKPDAGKLAQVGQVTGLGKTERIYAARFIGDVGYLVTFRQTDPLYTLDLSDPSKPKVAGELKITGYSAYLHPVGDGLLLGIGQDASEQGRTQGAAISLFDVADARAPKLLARKQFAQYSRSAVEDDPHAFLWWAPTKLALVPTLSFGNPAGGAISGGIASGVRVDRASGLTDVGSAYHGPEWDHPQIVRSVVVGSRVFTMSDIGVQAGRLTDLGAEGWMPWVTG
ncbi:MAG: beta-propeller domain-containing protein [Solirubrobacteraceae bacterium]|nr:beta-propeller domain-containing protein [Solirubrobacteraceae bacterium]